MAESVQAAMDRMVTPLRDFMDRGIFTESEIRSIVSRRRKSEYLLYRRTARLDDYLTYINDEINLETLRVLRHKRLLARRKREMQEQRRNKQQQQHAEKKWTAFSEHDTQIVRHVHLLYARLLRRFGNDNVSLYYQHAEFAKEFKSYTILGRVYAEALRKHPRVIGLWIEAASHEFFGCPGEDDDEEEEEENQKKAGGRVGKGGTGGSISNARVLMQRALRVNSKSEELWRQYFALEMHYVQKVRGRRKILQLGETEGGEGDAIDSGNENDDHAMPLIIYRNAIKTLPDDVSFRLSFIELCQSFPQTDDIEDEIMLSIEGDFDSSEDAWIARATYVAEKHKTQQEQKKKSGFLSSFEDDNAKEEKSEVVKASTKKTSLDVLNEATDKLPTAKMYLLTFQFVRSQMREMLDKAATDTNEENDNKDVDMATSLSLEIAQAITKHASFLGKIFKKSQKQKEPSSKENLVNTSSDLVLEIADYLLHSGQPQGAVNLLKRAVDDEKNKDKSVKKDGRIWIRWADIVGRIEESSSPSGSSSHIAAQNILRKGLEFIEVNEPGHRMVLIELIQLLLDDDDDDEENCSGISLEKKQKMDAELFSLIQRLLLLSARGISSPIFKDTKDSVSRSVLPDLCLRHLHYSKAFGGTSKARKSYDAVLFQSGYTRSCEGMDDDEVEGITSYFDACVEIERSVMMMAKANVIGKKNSSKKSGRNSATSLKAKKKMANEWMVGEKKGAASNVTAATKKEARHRLNKIYDAAMGFFREGGNDAAAMEYRQRRDEELVYS